MDQNQNSEQLNSKSTPWIMIGAIGCVVLVLCSVIVLLILFGASALFINSAGKATSNFVNKREEVQRSNDTSGVKNLDEINDIDGLKTKASEAQVFVPTDVPLNQSDDKQYISIFIEVINDSDSARSLDPHGFTISSENFSPYMASTLVTKSPALLDQEVEKGKSVSGYLVFEVEKTPGKLYLQYTELSLYDLSYVRRWAFNSPS